MDWASIAPAAVTLFFVMDPLGNMPIFNAILEQFDTRQRVQILAREMLFALAILTASKLAFRPDLEETENRAVGIGFEEAGARRDGIHQFPVVRRHALRAPHFVQVPAPDAGPAVRAVATVE